MSMPAISNLRDVRTNVLGYRLGAVAEFSGISRERLANLEAGEPLTVFEAEALARVYGIDADRLADERIHLNPGDGVAILTLQEEFRHLDDSMRLQIVLAANAARDLTQLEQQAGVPRIPQVPR